MALSVSLVWREANEWMRQIRACFSGEFANIVPTLARVLGATGTLDSVLRLAASR